MTAMSLAFYGTSAKTTFAPFLRGVARLRNTIYECFPGKICEPEYLPEKDCYRLNNPDGYSYCIGGYKLFDYIGEGGSRLVYKALSTSDGNIVMIKENYQETDTKGREMDAFLIFFFHEPTVA